MREKIVNTCEVSLYLGSKEGYNGREFDEQELIDRIAEYQASVPNDDLLAHCPAMPVRVTPTFYMFRDYMERGWGVTAICYPRRPYAPWQITKFMQGLAKHLLDTLKQNRISVLTPWDTYMYESDNPEDRHDAPSDASRRPAGTG